MIEGITMDADSLRTVGTFVGTGGMCVLDEDTDIVKFLIRIAKFYDHESCGQCTPCREGTGWFVKMLKKIDAGHGAICAILTPCWNFVIPWKVAPFVHLQMLPPGPYAIPSTASELILRRS